MILSVHQVTTGSNGGEDTIMAIAFLIFAGFCVWLMCRD
jgi:hypothetical protein